MLTWVLWLLLSAFAVGFSLTAQAQIPSSEQPGRLQDRFIDLPAPQSLPAGPRVSLPSTVPPPGADRIALVVVDVRIVGATVYSSADFADLTNEILGQTVTVAAIYQIAQQITSMYGNDGYVLSRAVVPPQDLDPNGGVVTIQVIEGYVDRVAWPDSLDRYRDFFSDYTANITGERPANIRTIMRYLLLAGDLPGIDVSSRFEASADNEAASTLIVETDFQRLDAEAWIDNRGTEARGPWQFLASATANNTFGWHEALTATFAGAFEIEELQYAAVAYRQVLTSEGLTFNADVSYSWGEPGTAELEVLEFSSESLNANAGLSYPVIRNRDRNLTLSGLFFLSESKGDILATTNSDDRLLGLRFAAAFDTADSWNGITQLLATFSQGIDGLGSTSNDNPNASRENGRVDFTKIDAIVIRDQPLKNNFSLRFAAGGQYAFMPLLASEECGYGGRLFGRAFDPSEITGDSCVFVSGELRFDLPETAMFSLAQLYSYVDYGTVHRIDPSAGTPKNQDGASAGFGLRLGLGGRLNADISAAKPLTGRDDDGWRGFLMATASY